MDCTPAIPPQAAMKSPLFIEGGAGEWSEATMCTCPPEFSPELVPIACGAEWRRTFGDRAQPLDVLVGEEQIVRTRFNGNIDTLCLGFGRQSDSAPTADVNDVEAGAGFFREQERTLDGFKLGDHRSRLEKGAHGSRREACTKTARQFFAFCVDGNRQLEACRFTQAIEQGHIVGARKFGKTRVAHERLEADHSTRGHFGHVGDRARHEPSHSPKSVMDEASSAARLRSNAGRSRCRAWN